MGVPAHPAKTPPSKQTDVSAFLPREEEPPRLSVAINEPPNDPNRDSDGTDALRDQWLTPALLEDVIAKIAPTPVLLVHGDHDAMFTLAHAERLFDLAGEPKRLLVGRDGRHAEDLIQPGFAELLARHVAELLERRP